VKNEVQNCVVQKDQARTPWRYVPPAYELFLQLQLLYAAVQSRRSVLAARSRSLRQVEISARLARFHLWLLEYAWRASVTVITEKDRCTGGR
jgi:hypothetical protein